MVWFEALVPLYVFISQQVLLLPEHLKRTLIKLIKQRSRCLIITDRCENKFSSSSLSLSSQECLFRSLFKFDKQNWPAFRHFIHFGSEKKLRRFYFCLHRFRNVLYSFNLFRKAKFGRKRGMPQSLVLPESYVWIRYIFWVITLSVNVTPIW